MLRLGRERDQLNVVVDQVGIPTNARDLAKVILRIIPQLINEKVELNHYSNQGVYSWYDFACAIFEEAEINCEVSAIPASEYPTPAQRPHYSVLSKKHLSEIFNITIPYWRSSLKRAVNV